MLEIDIWRAANQVIEQHPSDAREHAERRAVALLGAGDPAGHEAWLKISDAIAHLLRAKPDGNIH